MSNLSIQPYSNTSIILDNLQERILKKSFRIFYLSSILFRKHGSGKIVFLYGASCAGKSSLCNEIRKVLPRINLDSIDAAMDRRYMQIISNPEAFKIFFPERYVCLSRYLSDDNLLKFLKNPDTALLEECPPEEIPEVIDSASSISIIEELFFSEFHRNAAQLDLFNHALSSSYRGNDIVIDSVESRDFLIYKISKSFHCPLIVTLVHCSFERLAHHKAQRNEMAMRTRQEQDARFGTYPLLQFTDFFKPREGDQEIAVHSIEKETMISLYDKNLQEEMKHRPVPGLSEEDIRKRREFEIGILIQKLGLQTQGTVELTPKEYYDVNIDTGKCTPTEGAQKALTILLPQG